jgi:hypothetical protein
VYLLHRSENLVCAEGNAGLRRFGFALAQWRCGSMRGCRAAASRLQPPCTLDARLTAAALHATIGQSISHA